MVRRAVIVKFAYFFLLVCFCGCVIKGAGHFATTSLATTGSVAAKASVAVVKTSGQFTSSTVGAVVHASGSVAKSVAAAAFVTFRDTATGISAQVPYSEGLRLYAASQTAKFNLALSSFQLLRQGVPVLTAKGTLLKPGSLYDATLHPGDVIAFSAVHPKAARHS